RATKEDTTGASGTASFNQDSNSFEIIHNAATTLVFTTQPMDPTTAGEDLLPVIEIRDAYTNLVTSGSDAVANITMVLQSGSGNLSGTTTKMAVGGIAPWLGA